MAVATRRRRRPAQPASDPRADAECPDSCLLHYHLPLPPANARTAPPEPEYAEHRQWEEPEAARFIVVKSDRGEQGDDCDGRKCHPAERTGAGHTLVARC